MMLGGRLLYLQGKASHSMAFDAYEWLNEQDLLLSLLLLALQATHSTSTVPPQPHLSCKTP